MNAFAAITNLYILITITASVILIYSFKHQFDDSARYFLSAEILISLAAAFISFVSFYPNAINPISNGLHNFCALTADAMVLLSIISLYRKIPVKLVFPIAGLIAIFCAALESLRGHFGALIINPIYQIVFIGIAVAAAAQCFLMPDITLKNNRFLRWIGIFEIGIVLFFLIRFLANFAGIAIQFREATVTSITLFSIAICCNVFRYISYIALRITWVNPESIKINPLNEKLANAINEKDRLLSGLMTSNRVSGISALASTLAHQLSQPLTAVALQAQTLRRDLLAKLGDKDPSIESVNEICLQSDNLSELVRNLRQLFNSQKFQFQPLNLQVTTQQVIDIMRPMFESKKIALHTHFQSAPQVYGDKIQIQQVIINILNNAADAIEASSYSPKTITITIDQKDDFGSIAIQDSGTGIAMDLLPQIFELYQSTKNDGLGVGLWLCKTIVDHHHGKIVAQNNSSSGACFEVQIPLL